MKLCAFGIAFQVVFIGDTERVFGFFLATLIHLKGIGQHNAVEWLILQGLGVVGRFDVDGRNVIGQQDQFIRVNLFFVLARQRMGLDEVGLDQARNECTRSGKGIEDLHPLTVQISVKMLFEDFIDAVQDEIHDLDRGVNDTQSGHQFREGRLEKGVVEIANQILFGCVTLGQRNPLGHVLVEAFQLLGFRIHVMLVDDCQNPLHGLGYRVFRRKGSVPKQGLKNGLGQYMLGQHFHRFLLGNAAVQIFANPLEKHIESRTAFSFLDQVFNTLNHGAGNLGDILGPTRPVFAIAQMLGCNGIQGFLDVLNGQQGQFNGVATDTGTGLPFFLAG